MFIGSYNKLFLIYIFTDIDRASSIPMFVGGNQHLSSLHNTGGNNNNSNFYHENFVQHQQHRHQVDDNSGLFSSAYPVPAVSEPQHIRLQSPPHRLNHRNRNLHHNQQYETGTLSLLFSYIGVFIIIIITIVVIISYYEYTLIFYSLSEFWEVYVRRRYQYYIYTYLSVCV